MSLELKQLQLGEILQGPVGSFTQTRGVAKPPFLLFPQPAPRPNKSAVSVINASFPTDTLVRPRINTAWIGEVLLPWR